MIMEELLMIQMVFTVIFLVFMYALFDILKEKLETIKEMLRDFTTDKKEH